MTLTRHLGPSVVLLCGTFGSAEAYIDPGAASIVLQGVIGAVAAVLVLARGWGASIRKLLRRPLERRNPDARPPRKG